MNIIIPGISLSGQQERERERRRLFLEPLSGDFSITLAKQSTACAMHCIYHSLAIIIIIVKCSLVDVPKEYRY